MVFSCGFRDSCFHKLPGISILNKFFEDSIIFFLHFFRRANCLRSVPECSYNILFVPLVMARLEIKVPSRISGFSINSESKCGIVFLSFDEHIKGGDFVVLFTLAGKLSCPGSLSKQLSLNPLEKTMKLPVNMSKPRILTLKCFLYYMCDAVLKF